MLNNEGILMKGEVRKDENSEENVKNYWN